MIRLLTAFASLLLATAAIAAPPHVNLAWDPHPAGEQENLAKFVLHLGATSGNYDTTIDIPVSSVDLQNPTYKVEDLTAGRDYFFMLTAVDKFGRESGPSNEVDVNIPENGPSPPTLRFTMAVQASTDMINWRHLASIDHAVYHPREFYRIVFDRM